MGVCGGICVTTCGSLTKPWHQRPLPPGRRLLQEQVVIRSAKMTKALRAAVKIAGP